jgi:hypothetical protein
MSNFANLPTARMSFSETNTPRNVKTVIISVTKGGGIEYAIAPLKTAYPVILTVILNSAIPFY